MRNVTVLTKDGAFAHFFPPQPGRIDSSRVPTPREFAIQGQKIANARGSARGWGRVGHSPGGGGGALGIFWGGVCRPGPQNGPPF